MNERMMNRTGLFAIQSLIVFCLGALLVCLIIFLTTFFPALRFLFEAHTFGPLSEELVKFTVACTLLSCIDLSFISLPLLGTSFGLFEAMRHLQVYGSVGFWAVAAHIIFGILMSACLYLALRVVSHHQKVFYYAFALLGPASLHLIYNILIVPHLF